MPASAKNRKPPSCTDCDYRSLRMFCNLSEDALRDFNALGVQFSASHGSVLFREGDPALHVTVLCSGQVKLSCSSAEGKTLILKIAMGGDILGLSSVISGTVNEVTAEVVESSLVKIIPKDGFLRFLNSHGQASLHAAHTLSDQYRTAFFDARRLALSTSVRARLASVLLDWGRAAACGRPVMRFHMTLTHEELANMAGTSRETVTRTLGNLQREHLIQIRGSAITIPDPLKLEQEVAG
jgi:CRP/FNR family cyclic AMP-dependent transcriptional regulator